MKRRAMLLLGLLSLGAGSALPASGPPPLTVRFDSGSPGAQSYRWSFGDGGSSAEASPTHTYQRLGNFRAEVQVTRGGQVQKWSVPLRARIDQAVKVASGGGGAEIHFRAEASHRLRLRLKGGPTNQPYGFLEWPGGSRECPPNDQARDGTNQWEGEVPASAEFNLTIFDGANAGGTFQVEVEEPEGP